MPPIAPVYTWSQDAEAVTLSVPLKGTKAALVDLFAASTYVKLSFGRYLLELDLPHPIDDAAATASAKHGVLTVTLPKAIKGGEAWASLKLPPPPTATAANTSTTAGLDKGAIQERRAAAIEEHRSQEQRRAEEARERRAEMEQAAFQAQMAMQERARQEAAARAAEAKRQAEAAVFGHSMPPPAVPPPSTAKPAPAPTTLPPPPVRVMREATVRVRFTPRAFPTPARESEAAEEEDWLAKNHPSSFSVVPPTGAGAGGGNVDCEAHPAWLKARGDDLFKRADFAGALSAYDACLAADATHGGALANRAACQLKLGRLEECVADCTRALGLLLGGGGGGGGGGDKARLRLLTRRGMAYSEQGRYAEALADYRAAVACAPEGEDEALRRDCEKLKGLVDSGGAAGQEGIVGAAASGGEEQ